MMFQFEYTDSCPFVFLFLFYFIQLGYVQRVYTQSNQFSRRALVVAWTVKSGYGESSMQHMSSLNSLSGLLRVCTQNHSSCGMQILNLELPEPNASISCILVTFGWQLPGFSSLGYCSQNIFIPCQEMLLHQGHIVFCYLIHHPQLVVSLLSKVNRKEGQVGFCHLTGHP